VDLGHALRTLGLDVVMWAGSDEQRRQITRQAWNWRRVNCWPRPPAGAQLEGITAVLLLTGEDDFNALGATCCRAAVEGPVYPARGPPAQPRRDRSLYRGEILFDSQLTRYEVSGATQRRPDLHPARDGVAAADGSLLFSVPGGRQACPVTRTGPPEPQEGGHQVLLVAAAGWFVMLHVRVVSRPPAPWAS
jgi:hypothetical protein